MFEDHRWGKPLIVGEIDPTQAIVLSLGTNLGGYYEKEQHLSLALSNLARLGTVVAVSSVYETEPWGFDSQNQFLNAVVILFSDLSKERLLYSTQAIEKSLGRNHKSVGGVYKDRIIDIDIIDYKGVVCDTEELTLPHKLMQERLFVLNPLCEIYPQYKHPYLLKTAVELQQNLLK